MTSETKKEELSKKLDTISRIYINSLETFLYTEYFHNPETQEEINILNKSAHRSNLFFIRHTMYRSLIVELSKLFSNSRNDIYSLFHIIYSDLESFTDVDMHVLQSWRHEWEILNPFVAELLTLRNKLYAHTDLIIDMYKNIDMNFEKIKRLIDFAEAVVILLNKIVSNAEFIPMPPTFDREGFLILKLLSTAEQERLKEISQKYRNWRDK